MTILIYFDITWPCFNLFWYNDHFNLFWYISFLDNYARVQRGKRRVAECPAKQALFLASGEHHWRGRFCPGYVHSTEVHYGHFAGPLDSRCLTNRNYYTIWFRHYDFTLHALHGSQRSHTVAYRFHRVFSVLRACQWRLGEVFFSSKILKRTLRCWTSLNRCLKLRKCKLCQSILK